MMTHYNHENNILTKEIERENGNLLELQEKLNNQ